MPGRALVQSQVSASSDNREVSFFQKHEHKRVLHPMMSDSTLVIVQNVSKVSRLCVSETRDCGSKGGGGPALAGVGC